MQKGAGVGALDRGSLQGAILALGSVGVETSNLDTRVRETVSKVASRLPRLSQKFSRAKSFNGKATPSETQMSHLALCCSII